MKLLPSTLTLLLSRQVAVFNLALAAAVPRRDVATQTITKTIVYTEVRRLSRNLGNDPEAAATEQLSKRDKTVKVNSNSTHDSNTELFNLRVDLASEGYISIYVPSIAVSSFCDGVLKQGGDNADTQELLLAVYNATNAVKIPVHRGDATSFCKQAQNKNAAKSNKASGISTASAMASTEKPAISSSGEDILESTTSTHKLKASKTLASEIASDSSEVSTPTMSNAMAGNSASRTDDSNDDYDTSTSAKKASHSITSSDAASTTPESAMETSSDDMSSSSSSDDTEDASATLDSPSLPSQTPDNASIDKEVSSEGSTVTVSQAGEADESHIPAESTSSKKKKKISTLIDSDAATPQATDNASSEEDSSADPTTTASQASEADESDIPIESTSSKKNLSTSIESDASTPQPTDDASSEEAAVETSSTDDGSDNSTDDSNDSTRSTADAANVLGAADPVPHLTVSSINSWYNVINSYMSSAAATATVDLDVDDPSATVDSIDSENGAARRGMRRTVVGNPAMTISSINSGIPTQTLHTATSRLIARSKPSSNAGAKRVMPLSLLWRKEKRQDGDDSDETTGDEDDSEPPTSTSTHHKPNPTRTHPSEPLITKLGKSKGKGHTGDSDKDHAKSDKKDGEKTKSNPEKSTAKDKDHAKETAPKNQGQDQHKAAPTLPSDLSFALATPTKSKKRPQSTASIPSPPPGSSDTPSGVIIWDPECIPLHSPSPSPDKHSSPSADSNENEKREVKGCWRTLTQTEHPLSSNAWNILSDRQNRQLVFVLWCVLALMMVQFLMEFLALRGGEWHLGRGMVWRVEGWRGVRRE